MLKRITCNAIFAIYTVACVVVIAPFLLGKLPPFDLNPFTLMLVVSLPWSAMILLFSMVEALGGLFISPAIMVICPWFIILNIVILLWFCGYIKGLERLRVRLVNSALLRFAVVTLPASSMLLLILWPGHFHIESYVFLALAIGAAVGWVAFSPFWWLTTTAAFLLISFGLYALHIVR